jgi:enoyl-CoA hydratase/carnithine racemase
MINRPARRNAMSSELVERLIRHFADFNDRADCRAIVLAGAAPGFCAGSDLAELAIMDNADRTLFEAESGRLGRMLATLSVPVIAAVTGFAIGGGLTLATSCDIVLTTADARWSLPEVPIGLFPAWGLASVERRIGRAAARRLAWGMDALDGKEAVRLGLADKVAADPHGEAMTVAQQLAQLPRAQVASVKEFFAADVTGERADQLANQLFERMSGTPAAQTTFQRFR